MRADTCVHTAQAEHGGVYHMKKLMALLMALMLGPTVALAQDAAATPAAAEPVIVAIATPMSGYLYSNMWGTNNVDANIRSLLHGYNTVAWHTTGEFSVDETVVNSFSATADGRGNRTYTFDLAQGLTYNDGSPITARDYVFTVLLQSDPSIPLLGGQNTNFDYLTGYADYAAGNRSEFSGVRLIGERRFSITVMAGELPYFFEPTLMDVYPTPIQAVAPGYAVRDDGRGAYLTQSGGTADVQASPVPLTAEMLGETLTGVGGYVQQPRITCGPYQLTHYDAAANTLSMTINPMYRGNYEGRKPELENITIIQMDNTQAVDAYARGDVQIVHKLTDAVEVNRVRALQLEGKGDVANYLSAGYTFLAFACEQAPTDDANVRLAIAMCIDRNTFCTELYQGNALPVYAYYGYGQWMVADNTDALAAYEIGFDVDTARDLLIKAGFIYNEDGTLYEDGRGQVRCRIKKGRLTPLDLKWAKTAGKASDMLYAQLSSACGKLGIRLTVTDMGFSDMLWQYFRMDGQRSYNLFFMTETFSFAFDPYREYNINDVWQGATNTSGLRDERLMYAARAMRRVQNGDTATFIAKWLKFQDRWRVVMPTAPVCSNVYFGISQPWLYEFSSNVRFGLARALLYTTRTQPAQAEPVLADAPPAVEMDAAAGQ